MPRTNYYLRAPGMIDGNPLAAGDLIATVETPDGVDAGRAVSAIVNNLASANPPAATTAAPPAPEDPAKKAPAVQVPRRTPV